MKRMAEGAGPALKVLEGLGLTTQQAEVYLLLLRRGPLAAAEVAEAVSVPRTRVYELMKALQEQGLVTTTLESPRRFRSREIRHFVEDERQRLRAEEAALSARLPELERVLPKADPEGATGATGAFTPLTGGNRVNSRLVSLLTDAKKGILVRGGEDVVPLVGRLLDACASGVEVRVLHDVDRAAMKSFLRLQDAGAVIQHSVSPEHLSVLIVDDKECLIVFPRASGQPPTSGLWTDEPHFVAAQVAALKAAWTSGMPLEARKRQLEGGEAPRTTELLGAAYDRDPQANALAFLDSALRLIDGTQSEIEMSLPLAAVPLLDWDRLCSRLEFVDCRMLLPVPRPGTPVAKTLARLMDVMEIREAPSGLQNHATLVRDDEECLIAIVDPRPHEFAPCWESVIVSNQRGLVSASRGQFEVVWNEALGLHEAATRFDSGDWWFTSYRAHDAIGWAREALTTASSSVAVQATQETEGLIPSLLKSAPSHVRVETSTAPEGSAFVIIVDEGLCVVIEQPRLGRSADGVLRLDSIGFAKFTNSEASVRAWGKSELLSRTGSA